MRMSKMALSFHNIRNKRIYTCEIWIWKVGNFNKNKLLCIINCSISYFQCIYTYLFSECFC